MMDWQQEIALLVVAVTASCFAIQWVRRRRQSRLGVHHTGCLCPGASPEGGMEPPRGSITYRSKKGERPQVIVKQG